MAVVTGSLDELESPGSTCKLAEQEWDGLLVVPDVGATSVATAGVVEGSFPTPEVSVGSSETGL